MNKKLIEELRENLTKKKFELESELKKFAEKDKNLEGDWDTRFPKWNGDSGSSALERAADEVEEYSTLLPIEHSLELRLKDIDLALKKIKKGEYGPCEKCNKEIPTERLRVSPEARCCLNCQPR